MTRTGKIARLPREIRAQLNRRVEGGEPEAEVLAWLNRQPQVQAGQAARPGLAALGEADLADWQETGYRDWLGQQAALEQVRQLSAEAAELAQAGEGALTDTLAQFLAAQYVLATKAVVRQAAGAAVEVKTLQALCNDVVALRRGDHNAGWLRLEREKLALVQRKAEKAQAALENKELTEQEKAARMHELFGIR